MSYTRRACAIDLSLQSLHQRHSKETGGDIWHQRFHSVYENIRLRPSTRRRIDGVFKFIHFRERFGFYTFTVSVFIVFVWTEGLNASKSLRLQSSSCGRGLKSYDGNCKENIALTLNFALSLLRLFHVYHVVQNRRSALSFAWHEWFSCKGKEWKIYCCELALSSEPQIWKFHVVVWQTTSKHCTKKRAARVARLFFFIQPIKSLIFLVVVGLRPHGLLTQSPFGRVLASTTGTATTTP